MDLPCVPIKSVSCIQAVSWLPLPVSRLYPVSALQSCPFGGRMDFPCVPIEAVSCSLILASTSCIKAVPCILYQSRPFGGRMDFPCVPIKAVSCSLILASASCIKAVSCILYQSCPFGGRMDLPCVPIKAVSCIKAVSWLPLPVASSWLPLGRIRDFFLGLTFTAALRATCDSRLVQRK